MLHAMSALSQLRETGYTVLEGVLSPSELATVRAELSPYLQGRLFGRNDFEGFHTERVYALLAKAPSIAGLIENAHTRPLIEALLPKGYWLSAALAINVHPGETAQSFHIDDDTGGGNPPRPRAPQGVSTIWAIDDFTETNGATEVVPGSHLWDDTRQPTDAEAVPVTMPAGSVIVFAGNLYHRGGANRSDSTRLAITPQYCARWLRQIENMVLAVPPKVASTYSDRVQALLGYSVVDPGFMGYVDGLHPRRLLQDP